MHAKFKLETEEQTLQKTFIFADFVIKNNPQCLLSSSGSLYLENQTQKKKWQVL